MIVWCSPGVEAIILSGVLHSGGFVQRLQVTPTEAVIIPPAWTGDHSPVLEQLPKEGS